MKPWNLRSIMPSFLKKSNRNLWKTWISSLSAAANWRNLKGHVWTLQSTFIENQTTNRPWKRLVDVLQKHSHTSALVLSPYPLTIPWNTIKWQLLCSNMLGSTRYPYHRTSTRTNVYGSVQHVSNTAHPKWSLWLEAYEITHDKLSPRTLYLHPLTFPMENHMYICTSIVAYENILCTCIQKAVHTYTWHTYRKHIHCKHTNMCNILNTNTHTYITFHHLTSHYMHTHTYEQ